LRSMALLWEGLASRRSVHQGCAALHGAASGVMAAGFPFSGNTADTSAPPPPTWVRYRLVAPASDGNALGGTRRQSRLALSIASRTAVQRRSRSSRLKYG